LVWIIQSGNPFTPATGKLYVTNPATGLLSTELIYGKKNSSRMQPYHRLDVSFNHTVKTANGNKAVWTFGIYNVYNRINPYDYYYDNDNDVENDLNANKALFLYKTGLFSIIPNISYKLFFDLKAKPAERTNKEKKRYHWWYFDE
jgi:hypothetical protein